MALQQTAAFRIARPAAALLFGASAAELKRYASDESHVTLPILHSLSSPELDRGELPPDPCSCAILMQAEIGTTVGGDLFNFTVSTPDKLLGDGGAVTWGRGYLIVERFSWETAEGALRKLLMHADRPTWSESAAILSQELHWEFENYTPAPSK